MDPPISAHLGFSKKHDLGAIVRKVDNALKAIRKAGTHDRIVTSYVGKH